MQDTIGSDQTRPDAAQDAGGPGLVRALRAQLGRRREPVEISFEHEEYVGRNVLSITVRDENDVDEIPVYYEQPVFARWRVGRPAQRDADA